MKPITMRGDRLAFFIEVLDAIDALQSVAPTSLNPKTLRRVLKKELNIDIDDISNEMAFPSGAGVVSFLIHLLLPNVSSLQHINLDITDFWTYVLEQGKTIECLARAIAGGFITPEMVGSKTATHLLKENQFQDILSAPSDRLRNLTDAGDEPLV